MISRLLHLTFRLIAFAALAVLVGVPRAMVAQEVSPKPTLLYSRYFNAEGDTRYLPAGTYKVVLERLREHYEVRVNDLPFTPANLTAVRVVLIANPNDQAVGTNPPPHHCSAEDVAALNRFVRAGGGLVAMGNQENHNLETKDFNALLASFGMQFENRYTDAKQLVLSPSVPIIGGLRWAYYTGNRVVLAPGHEAKPRAVVTNDLQQKTLGGPRDEDGVLLASAEPGKGHVVVVTDAGWISNDALSGKGIGSVAIKEHDNFEIFLRLARWAAGQ
jgi:hypothetical protein